MINFLKEKYHDHEFQWVQNLRIKWYKIFNLADYEINQPQYRSNLEVCGKFSVVKIIKIHSINIHRKIPVLDSLSNKVEIKLNLVKIKFLIWTLTQIFFREYCEIFSKAGGIICRLW